MKPWFKQSSLMFWLLLGLLATVPVLAYWQYHWLGEVSQAERERMQRNLKNNAAQFAQEFDQELTFAYVSLQEGAGTFDAAAPFAERYRQWAAAAAHPQLVRAVIEATAEADGQFTFKRYDLARGEAVALDPGKAVEAQDLVRLQAHFANQQHSRKRFEQVLQNFIGPGVLSEGFPGVTRDARTINLETHRRTEIKTSGNSATVIQVSTLDALNENLPGLVIPLAQFPSGLLDALAATRYRVILFDQDFLRQELFPALARKHLFSLGANEYQYAVLTSAKSGPTVLYQSDPAQTAQSFATADVAESFFKLRLDPRDRILLRHFGQTPASVALPAASPSASPSSSATSNDERKSYSVGIYTKEMRVGENASVGRDTEPLTTLVKPGAEGAWKLVVKHRAGSLEAAVAKLRQRNLALSLGVLLLLSVSVGFIVLTSRRAQTLAGKQMEFVAGVSHELRTPLAVICSAAENLADGVIENPDQIKRYGTLIRDEGRRLTGMVEQVLEYAGAQSGKKTYELRPTAPEQVVADALTALHLPLTDNGFLVEQDLAAALPPIAADEDALSRALQNLLSNAMKYSGESRWLGMRVFVANTPLGEELRFVVTDRGLGIAPAELPHIFEPFYRGKEVSAAQIHGNGLGLSLVKHILDAHGGRVSVESQLGQGSTFILHLPVVREAVAPTPLLSNEYEQAPATR